MCGAEGCRKAFISQNSVKSHMERHNKHSNTSQAVSMTNEHACSIGQCLALGPRGR